MFYKVYVSAAEKEEIDAMAANENCSVSALFKRALNLQSASTISDILSETIALAEALPYGNFSIPDLYTKIAWSHIAEKVNPGQLGKQFYEQVENGNVKGVTYKEMKNRLALYTKRREA